MKLLLIWLDVSVVGERPHHGLASIAGYLKRREHSVELIHIRQKSQVDDIINVIGEYHPDCIGYSLVTSQRGVLDEIAGPIRSRFDGPIIAGGVHPTIDPYDTLKCAGIDGVCVGEGELALADVADRFDKGIPYEEVPSMIWRSDPDRLVRPRFERDVNKVMEYDYSLFNTKGLIKNSGGYFYVMISRGCPFSCTYCSNKALKEKYESGKGWFRILDPFDAIDHLMTIKDRYDIKGFTFDDDIMPPNVDWLRDFSREYKKRINLPYICNCRFEIVQDEDVVKLMKDTGCIQVRFGLESGDETFRREYLKRYYSDDQINRSVELLRKYRIEYFLFTIVGFPYETSEQMHKTLHVVRKIRPHFGEIHFFFPYPGTELHDKCKEDNMMVRKPEDCNEDNRGDRPILRLNQKVSKTCISIHRKLFAYYLIRAFMTMIKYEGQWLETALYHACMISPKLIFKVFGSQENWLRKGLRKIYLSMTLANA